MQIDIQDKALFAGSWPVDDLRDALTGARCVVVVAHKNADGDAVGAVLGMRDVLAKMPEHKVTMILPDGVPDDLQWLPRADEIVDGKAESGRCTAAIAEADLIVALDVSSMERTGNMSAALVEHKCTKILIDHHIETYVSQFDLVISEPDASSTCELVYWSMRECFGKECFSTAGATSLYAGICTDTGTFSYSNDRPSVYYAAAYLLSYGIDPMAINRKIRNTFSEQRMRFYGYAMDRLLRVYANQGVALMVVRREDMLKYGMKDSDLSGLINNVMQLKDIDCGILVREQEDCVRLSFRSKEQHDVNRLARHLFDGGGHERAAGATSHLGLEATVRRVMEELNVCDEEK